jgi:lipopolysaccharide/colanic/teichoic acid biosynthesis glycosyltransferase
VKLSSPGPVLFRQKRVGQYGKQFTFLKFRSMKDGNDPSVHEKFVAKLMAAEAEAVPGGSAAEGRPMYKLVDDPRITRFGAFLRRTSLDELPQLVNVLLGEMSLVGPRPPIPYEVDKYAPWHLERLVVAKPGITGLWQVEGRSRVSFNEMVRMDLRYAKEWSLWLDIKLLVRTIGVVCKMTGAR